MNQPTIERVNSVKTLSPKEVVQRLQTEAASNKVFKAVCQLFINRERTRQQVTVPTMRLAMAREGHHYTKDECIDILKFMANLGLGTIDKDYSGEVRALKDIKFTLQSIGDAALHKGERLQNFAPAPEFKELPKQTIVPLKAPRVDEATSYATSITINLDGSPVNFPLPRGLTLMELGALLDSMFATKR